jgi:hypothetical protein
MRRRKSAVATVQTNVRLERTLIDEIEAGARAHGSSLSTELRRRLIAAEPSLADFLTAMRARRRNAIESCAREKNKDIVEAWKLLQKLDALDAKYYADTESVLIQDGYVTDAAVRTLLRGASAMPDEATPKHKPSQQEREKGGKS